MKINARCKPRAMSLQGALALLAPLISAAALCASAAEPLVWERRPNRPAPAQFDTYHGETLDFRCAFEGFGAPPFGQSSNSTRLYFQTNGMGAAWWSLPATVSVVTNYQLSTTNYQLPTTNYQLRAIFPPSADPGAERLTVFFGAPSNAYAAAQVRFRNSPGPSPNVLDPPDVLDWQAELAAVSNALAAAIEAVATNLPPGMTTNDVCNIVTNVSKIWTETVQSPGEEYWMIDQKSATFEISDVKWDGYDVSFRANGEMKTIDCSLPNYNVIVRDGNVYLYVYDANNEIPVGSNPDNWNLSIGTTGGYDNIFVFTHQNNVNTLGLAMASDLTNLVSQTDGKMGVLDVGVNNSVTGSRAAAIGTNNVASGSNAIAFGRDNTANNATAIALGRSNTAGGTFAMATGSGSVASNNYSFVWNRSTTRYGSHGTGTFNVNPQNGVYGLYIGEQNLYEAMVSAITAKTPATVSFLDEDGNEESSRTYPAIGVVTAADVAPLQNSVNAMWTYVYGGSVWIAVTNYMRTVAGVAPSFQLWEVRDGATNCVYSSAEEIDTRTEDMIHTCRTNLESQVAGVVAAMPDRAWSKYQSATGNESPEGVTIVSTPIIQLTGGGEWYRYVDVSSNSVWFLRSNGVHTFGDDTNGYFRILDDEGNPTFEVRKTDSYTVDAVPESIHFDGDGNFCISFQSNIQPMIYTSPSLSVPAFSGEGEDPNITVTWSHAGGVYTATVEQTVKSASLFAYAKIEVQGTTVIRNTAPTDVSGGILCTDGIHKCRPRYTNGAITWEVVP